MAEEKKISQAKIYRDLAYGASMEASRLTMLKIKINAEIKLLNALSEYYDEISELERSNSYFGGFDLNTL